MQDPKRLCGNKPENLRASLGRMVQEAHIDANCDRNAANQRMREWLDWDRRFDNFDKARLIARVEECGKTGGYLDLADPYLYGGQKRPLER